MPANFETDFWTFTTLSNLHAGAGDGVYQLVDKEVQRDPLGGKIPIVHGSSLKGAFREMVENQLGETHETVKHIFGGGTRKKGGAGNNESSTENTAGSHSFFEARLLCIPVRGSTQLFYRATSPELLLDFCENLKRFDPGLYQKYGTDFQPLINLMPKPGSPIVFEDIKDQIVEDSEYTLVGRTDCVPSAGLTDLIGKHLVLFHHDDLSRICDKGNLPIVSRNVIVDGISNNLWFEEVVPRESRFWFMVRRPLADTAFATQMTATENILQLGANATVGYGVCHFNLLQP
jgi:CRISPR-associated protein Cmr4